MIKSFPPSDIFEEFAFYTNDWFSDHFLELIPNQYNECQKENGKHRAVNKTIDDADRAYDQNPKEYLNLGFMDKIGELYDENEKEIITPLSTYFPRIAIGFCFFSLFNDSKRSLIAANYAELQREIPWSKLILPTTLSSEQRNRKINRGKLTDFVLSGDPEKDLVKEVFERHDFCKTVTGYLTPSHALNEDDRKRIEQAAITLLTTGKDYDSDDTAQKVYDAYNIYEGDDPEHDTIRSKCKDIEVLEEAMKALYITWICPEDQRESLTQKLQPFIDNAENKLKTQQIKNFYTSFKNIKLVPEASLTLLIINTQNDLENNTHDIPEP
jgi:hypothetical protein